MLCIAHNTIEDYLKSMIGPQIHSPNSRAISAHTRTIIVNHGSSSDWIAQASTETVASTQRMKQNDHQVSLMQSVTPRRKVPHCLAGVLAFDFFLLAPALATRKLLWTAANLAKAADFKSAL